MAFAMSDVAGAASNGSPGGYVAGVDIGGTFTDCTRSMAQTGAMRTGEGSNAADDRARSFFEAIEDAASKFGLSLDALLSHCDRLVHGTTTGTNALITRSGARVGVLTTAGHGDAPFVMKGFGRLAGIPVDRMLDISVTDKPVQLVPRSRVVEVVERVDFEGNVVVPLDEESARAAIASLVEDGVDAVTVSFLAGHAQRRA